MKDINKIATGIGVDHAATNAGKAKAEKMIEAVRQHVECSGKTRPEVDRRSLLEESIGGFCF